MVRRALILHGLWLSDAMLALCVLSAAGTDLRTGLIPNAITYPAWLLIVATMSLEGRGTSALVGSLGAALPLFVLRAASHGRALGGGDVKLAACIGAALGAATGLLCLSAAFMLGGVAGTALLVARKAARGDRIAFAPFLAAGTLVVLAYERWRGTFL